MSTFFIDGETTFIKGPRKLSNPSSWLIIVPVAAFHKILLFSKNLITFMISFISVFVSVIPEPLLFLIDGQFLKQGLKELFLIAKAVSIAN